jgi:hypothetical protein
VVCGKAIVSADSTKRLALSCRRLVAVTLLPLQRPHGEGSRGALVFPVLAQVVALLLAPNRLLTPTDQSKNGEILLLRRQSAVLQRAQLRPPRLTRGEKPALAVLANRLMRLCGGTRARLDT